MKTLISKSLLAVAMTTVLGAASTSVMADTLPDFYVDPASSGAYAPPSPYPAPVFQADKITGNYVERVDFLSATTFEASIKWQAGQFVSLDGTNPLNGGGATGTGLGNTYNLYGTYLGQGTYTNVAGFVTFLFTASTLNLFLDPNLDTVLSDPGVNNANLSWVASSNADDKLLATGVLAGGPSVSGNGGNLNTNIPTGLNAGSFGITDTFALTADGKKYFIDPVPFYNVTLAAGQFNSFPVVVGGSVLANGSADFTFNKVPEPTTLALLGMGLMGLGLKRSKKA